MRDGKTGSDLGSSLCYDPMLARILSLEELPIPHRLNWICNARSVLTRRKDELSSAWSDGTLYEPFLREATLELIEIRLRALDELYQRIVGELKKSGVEGGARGEHHRHVSGAKS